MNKGTVKWFNADTTDETVSADDTSSTEDTAETDAE